MFGSDKNNRLVGAREKHEKAQKFKPGSFAVKSKREGKEPSPVIPLAVIYGISVVLAMFLTEGPMKEGLGFHTGNPSFDRTFFGPGLAGLSGDPDTDRGITIFLRGTFLFALGGVLPFCTYLWQKVVDNTRLNIYLAFWGVTLGMALLYYLSRDMLGPIFKQVLDIIL